MSQDKQAIKTSVKSATDHDLYQATWNGSELTSPVEVSQTTSLRKSSALQSTEDAEVINVLFQMDDDKTIISRLVVHNNLQTVDQETGQLPMQWTEGTSSVSLTWWQPAGSHITWSVQRDGEEIGQTASSSYTDVNQETRTSQHIYPVSGEQPVTVDGMPASKPYYYEVAVPPADDTSLGKSITDPTIRTLESNSDITTQAATAESAQSYLITAFIPEKYLDKPATVDCGSNVAYIGGDNRGFVADDQVYGTGRLKARTGQSFLEGKLWDNGFQKHTGTSRTYDKNHKELAHKNAGTAGITYNHEEHTNSYTERTVKFHEGIPLCKVGDVFGAPAIDSNVYVRSEAKGTMQVSGEHDQAPNHEITYYFESTKALKHSCAYRFKHRSFNHLFPAYPNATFDIQWNPNTGSYPSCAVH